MILCGLLHVIDAISQALHLLYVVQLVCVVQAGCEVQFLEAGTLT